MAAPHLWITEYLDEVESDFSAFHGVRDYDEIDGPKFLRMAAQLPLYEGALRMRITIQNEEKGRGGHTGTQNRSMSMQEALASTKTGQQAEQDRDIKTLQTLNIDGQNPLFEYSTG